MEFSQTLAIESFSRSWLTTRDSSLDGLEELLRPSIGSLHEGSSKRLECKTLKSQRSMEEAQNFNFDVPISEPSDVLVHADQLFSDGLIKPVFVNQSKIEASDSIDAVHAMPSSCSSRAVVPATHIQCHFFGRWRKLSERILQKWFQRLRSLWPRARRPRKNTRVDDVDRRAWEVKSRSNSPQASPRRSTASCCDIENSIYEAVLHCKRSIDK